MKPIASCLCLQAVVRGVFRGELCPISSCHTQLEHLLYPGIGFGDSGKKKVQSAPRSELLLEKMHTPLYGAQQELCAVVSKPQGADQKREPKDPFLKAPCGHTPSAYMAHSQGIYVSSKGVRVEAGLVSEMGGSLPCSTPDESSALKAH